MENMIYLLIGGVFFLFLVLLSFLVSLAKKMENSKEDPKIMAVLEKLSILSEQNRNFSDQNKELRQMLDNKLAETHRANREQLTETMRATQGIADQSVKSISQISEKLAKLEETNKQIISFSSQLQGLQDILKNPKQRGILGEYFLEETLKNVLPPNSYEMQYNLGKGKDGNDLIVDAVVKVKDKLIPVDSKFSLENYEKLLNTKDQEERKKIERIFKDDLKKRIDETSKYILPEKGTMDFAFMFIPSEAIYYDLLINKVGAVQISTRDLIEYAFQDRKVIIVSPTSFLAYLQTVLQGLRALKIEEGAKFIRANVAKLEKHILAFEEYMKKLGASMGTTVNHYNIAYKEVGKIIKDTSKITEEEKAIEPVVLEKPKLE